MLWMWLACLSPTACPDSCEKIVGECGLGSGLEDCVSACRDIQVIEYERRDFSHCVALADCGDLVVGECAYSPSYCPAPLYVHVALGPECGAPEGSAHGLIQDSDCVYRAEGDWGELGVPEVHAEYPLRLTFDGGCEVELNGYVHCDIAGQTCEIAMESVI